MKLWLGLVVVAGCTDDVRLDRDQLVGLAVDGGTVAITDLATPSRLAIAARGSFADGSERDVTDAVDWTIDTTSIATLDDHTLVTTNTALGDVVVHAQRGELVATADVRVDLELALLDPAAPPPGALGPLALDPTRTPALLYPSDRTIVPSSIAPLPLEIDRAGNPIASLTLDGELVHVTVATAGDRWEPSAQLWSLIASAASTLEIGVVAGTPTASFAAPPSSLTLSPAPLGGKLTYWSAAQSSVVSTSLAGDAEPLYPAGGGKCVGCHAISRDGKQLAFGYDGEQLRTIKANGQTIIDNKAPVGWATFSPAGDLVLIADHGTLTLLDAATGAPVGPNAGRVTLPPGKKATHPDWSPDGRYVAVALANAIVQNTDVNRAEVARIPYTAGAWGIPEVLVANVDPRDNNYFPRYSPDGRFLAYVHALGTSSQATSAELRLIPAGGGVPIRLAAVGQPATMPAWAPATGELAWLAFVSTRSRGTIATPSQIWLTALSLDRATLGLDPSSVAFWLPGQNLTLTANNPVWMAAEQPR